MVSSNNGGRSFSQKCLLHVTSGTGNWLPMLLFREVYSKHNSSLSRVILI